MRFGREKAISITFVFALLLLLADGWVAYRSMVNLGVSRGWVIHTEEVLEKLQELTADVSQASSQQAGFVVSEKEDHSFMEGYEAAHLEALQHFRSLQTLTADNPRQQQRLRQLEPLLNKMFDAMSNVLLMRTVESRVAAERQLTSNLATRLQEEIRSTMQDMDNEERLLLKGREKDAATRFKRTTLLLGSIVAISYGLLLTVFVLLKREIRERRRSQAEVERANLLKSQFLASMSHELRTPLNAILGFSELLLADSMIVQDEKRRRWVNHIDNGGKHLLQLINDILDLSKIEAGHVELNIESFEVEAAIPEVISNIRHLARVKNITVNVEGKPNLVVLADRVRFKQVLYNLLNNAVKFTPEAGTVQLITMEHGDFAKISVVDTGVGINPADQKVVFDEFRQVGKSTRGIVEGTGLGLAITKKLVEKQGGVITVESTPGKGSCFSFTLPVGKRSVEPPYVPPTQSAGREKAGLILIVDDEPAARELLQGYLTSHGYRTEIAVSGSEALEKAAELNPNVILLDILMPAKSGWETLGLLKTNSNTSHIPVVIVSIVDDKNRGFALGAAEYLVKPINKQILLSALDKHLKGKGARKILIVDDEPASLQMARQLLSNAGFVVSSASSGREALGTLASTPVDAVLLDLMMPEMDGFEVLRRMKDDPSLVTIPVFILTAKDLTEKESQLLMGTTHGLFLKGKGWKEELLTQLAVLENRARC